MKVSNALSSLWVGRSPRANSSEGNMCGEIEDAKKPEIRPKNIAATKEALRTKQRKKITIIAVPAAAA
jgi:hypothetical protein